MNQAPSPDSPEPGDETSVTTSVEPGNAPAADAGVPRGWIIARTIAAAVGASAALIILISGWNVVTHSHPAYLVLLLLTLAGCGVGLWRQRRAAHRRFHTGTAWTILRTIGIVAALLWVGILVWLRPFSATDEALTAMRSDDRVDVTETATSITMAPAGETQSIGVFFQPGARVDARAYATTLRPLAEAGYPIHIVKQPLGIAFLASGAFDGYITSDRATSDRWIHAGHSLGGTVASITANDNPDSTTALLLWASYPASDISTSLSAPVLSISASEDGLATPMKIDEARSILPPSTDYVQIGGASHAQFGDYGTQPGDGTPNISNAEAHSQISNTSLSFISALDQR